MPFALVIIGLIFIVTGAKDTQSALGAELKSDFTGNGNFTWWLLSIGAVGTLGYAEPLKNFSRLFMALILVSFVLANGGFFNKLTEALQQGPVSPPVPEKKTPNSAAPSSGNKTSAGGSKSGGGMSLKEGVDNLLNAPNIVKGWADDFKGFGDKISSWFK